MTDPDSRKAIGDSLLYTLSVGDSISIDAEDAEGMSVEVLETPNSVPVRPHQSFEVICVPDSDDGVVVLSVQVTKLSEDSVDYDLYASFLPDEGEEEYWGEIRSLTVSDVKVR